MYFVYLMGITLPIGSGVINYSISVSKGQTSESTFFNNIRPVIYNQAIL